MWLLYNVVQPVPSGKLKSPSLKGKSTINVPCSIAMLNWQRVNPKINLYTLFGAHNLFVSETWSTPAKSRGVHHGYENSSMSALPAWIMNSCIKISSYSVCSLNDSQCIHTIHLLYICMYLTFKIHHSPLVKSVVCWIFGAPHHTSRQVASAIAQAHRHGVPARCAGLRDQFGAEGWGLVRVEKMQVPGEFLDFRTIGSL